MLKIENVDIDLDSTVTCGQIFRYEKLNDNSYDIIMSDRVINIKKENNNLIVDSNNYDNLKETVTNYFDLNRNYNELNDILIKNDSSLKSVIEFCNGFKIMNTPKFETCISYIISANNGVPQIKNTLDNISKEYGEKVIFNNKEYYLFPTIDALSKCTTQEFRNLKAGFRDKYLYEFTQKVYNKKFNLDLIDNLSTKDALEYLMKNKGIGMKVASCILIFAYSKFDVFPIDTWVKKYMKENYNIEKVKDIENYCKNTYKDYSGLFIQYIFHYSRNKKI